MSRAGACLITALAVAAGVWSGGAAAEPGYRVVGDWLVQRDRDRFSGAENVIALRLSNDLRALMVRCLDRKPSVVVKALDQSFAGETDLFAVTFRADQLRPIQSVAEALDDRTAEILIREEMVEQIAAGREVAFRFETKRARFDHVFLVGRGAQRAVAEVFNACKKSG